MRDTALGPLYPRAMNSESTSSARPSKSEFNLAATSALNAHALLALLGAGLILFGLALLSGELTLGSLLHENSWILSVTLAGLWNMIAGMLARLAATEGAHFWPLLLVLAGAGLLAVSRMSMKLPAEREGKREVGGRE